LGKPKNFFSLKPQIVGNMGQKYPDWVLKHKKKGIEIERRRNSYYTNFFEFGLTASLSKFPNIK
jgi:hypothetical protein